MKQVVNVGLLGLGTVGGGVFKVLKDRKDVEIIKIAVKEKATAQEIEGLDRNLLTEDAKIIVTNPDIDVIVEVIGGTGAAYEFIKIALENGKHVVTANKELIAKKGDELFEIAKALLLPGIPNNSLYVGFRFSISNSTLAFCTLSFNIA